jgi:hypothetical protein
MVTSVTPNASLRQLAINCSTPSDTCKGVGFVTPVRSPDNKPDPKRTRLSAHPSPTLPHALIDLQQSMLDVAENGEDEFVDEECKRYCIDDDPDEELELDSDDGEEDDEDVDSEETQSGNEVLATELKTGPTVTNPGFNYLIPVKDFHFFLRNYFSCKQCRARITETNLVSVQVGCACNVFWKCSNMDCGLHAEILAKKATTEVSGEFRKTYPDLPLAIGDYDINRQVVLACQQTGDGSRGMASTFCRVMSISRRSGWNRCFTTVEEQLGKAIILLGERIMKKNLEKEIAESPWDAVLEKAKLTFMMDGGWDQRASGKAYNSSSGRVVSAGGYTNKVCYLVYYSKR